MHSLKYFRSVMVCSENYGFMNFVTARQQPRLVLIVPSLHGRVLHLDAPGMKTLKLNLDQSTNKSPTVEAQYVFFITVSPFFFGKFFICVIIQYI